MKNLFLILFLLTGKLCFSQTNYEVLYDSAGVRYSVMYTYDDDNIAQTKTGVKATVTVIQLKRRSVKVNQGLPGKHTVTIYNPEVVGKPFTDTCTVIQKTELAAKGGVSTKTRDVTDKRCISYFIKKARKP